ncbi:MAG: hypothetical protein ABW169_00020 [Sphingobium sp.]
MPDDSRIREFAREHGCSFRWRAWAEGNRAYAELTVTRDGKHLYGERTNAIASEQDVLDRLTDWAIEKITAPFVPYSMPGWAPPPKGR